MINRAYVIWVIYICCNFIHCLFRKVFCNILIHKFQSHSPRTECLALYMSMISAKNIVFSCFGSLLQIPTFQIISWSPHSTMWLDIPHYKIKYNSLFFFYGFLSSVHFLFVSSQMFRCTLVFTPTDYILKHKNNVIKKKNFPRLYIY